MINFLSQFWPWYVAGPLIGLMVPILLLISSKQFGVSSNLRHICAAVWPGRVDFFRYDWIRSGVWNLTFIAGVVIGGMLSATILSGSGTVGISEATHADLAALGITDFQGLVPSDLFSWEAVGSLPGFIAVVVGGFFVGFGARYAGGCTSGHGISGLANFEWSSLVAVIGFFIGGLFITHLVYPFLL